MNIAIVGAGITGISTALELALDRHQVTVYEQMNAVAEDASFAPGGWLSPAATQSLATPGLGIGIKQLRTGSDLLHASRWIGSQSWQWIRQWKKYEKRASKSQDTSLSTALLALEQYSASLRQRSLQGAELNTEHNHSAMVLLRSAHELAFWEAQLPLLQANGTKTQILNVAQAQAIEPGLSQELAWQHALHFPQAQSINPRLWAHHLRSHAQILGARFCVGAHIESISTNPTGLYCNGQFHGFDAIIICTGAHTQLLAQLGMRLPIMPIWGYSISAPVRDPLLAPRFAVMDWAQQAVITRMGQRVRISAGLEMGSRYAHSQHTATLQRMYRLLNDWFPGGVHTSSPQVQTWKGVRAYLPDGLPACGASTHHNIWLNICHGSHGTSLASGCARAIADMVQHKQPAIDIQALSPARF